MSPGVRVPFPLRRVWVAGCVALAAAAVQGAVPGAVPADPAERGRILYETGRLADGTPVTARREGVGTLPPAAAACVACHRPSGRGGAEGGVLVPPVTGPVLFAPGQPPLKHPRLERQWLRHQTRSAYTEAGLQRALADGLDPDGKTLDPVMPRYRLNDTAASDLAAYLRTLGLPPPGIAGGTMHLASVFTPGASAARRATVRDAMQRWAQGLGFGARQVSWEARELQGVPSDWPRQLDAWQAARPAYALVSGAGGADWAPVDAWCEARRVPCLMPVIDSLPPPAADRPRHWAVHLSAGVEGEAKMIASRLSATAPSRVLQWTDSPAAEAAAQALSRHLGAAGGGTALPVKTLRWGAARPQAAAGDAVVLWLSAEHAHEWLSAARTVAARAAASSTVASGARAVQVLMSGQLAPPSRVNVPPVWRAWVTWASLRADPLRQQAGAALSLVQWSQRLGVTGAIDSPDLADVHAAVFFFGDAFAQARGIVDSDFLLERLEAAVDRRPAGAAYWRLSLGPGQRVAAQGGHFIGFQLPALKRLVPVSPFVRAVD